MVLLAEHLGWMRDDRILDLGAGPGQLSLLVAPGELRAAAADLGRLAPPRMGGSGALLSWPLEDRGQPGAVDGHERGAQRDRRRAEHEQRKAGDLARRHGDEWRRQREE